MRAFHLAFAALALSSALGACSEKSGALVAVKTTPAAVETLVTKLAAETFKGKATAAADIASVRDALPKEVSLTWTALTFDAATGATVLTGVKLTPKDSPQVGLSAEEVRLWDFDSEFAKARLSGQRRGRNGRARRCLRLEQDAPRTTGKLVAQPAHHPGHDLAFALPHGAALGAGVRRPLQ